MNPDNPNFRTPEEKARAEEYVRMQARVAELELQKDFNSWEREEALKRVAELEHALNRIALLTYGPLAYTAEYEYRVRKIISEALKEETTKP